MKTGASDDSRNAVSIHIGSDGRPSKEWHERVLIDDSNPEDIVIHITECESLRIDFDKSPQSGWEWNAAASLKMQQPETQAPIDLLPAEDSERISSADVPLARVRWSSIPPSPELLSRQSRHSGAGNETASRQETVQSIQDSPPSSEFRRVSSTDELQIVKTSYPPPNSAENAWRRRPIFWVSAAAMMVLAWVVGVFLMMSPIDIDSQNRPQSYFSENSPGFTGGEDASLSGESLLPLKTETAAISVVPATSESALSTMHSMGERHRVASNQTVDASVPKQKKRQQKRANVDVSKHDATPSDADVPKVVSSKRESRKDADKTATSRHHDHSPTETDPVAATAAPMAEPAAVTEAPMAEPAAVTQAPAAKESQDDATNDATAETGVTSDTSESDAHNGTMDASSGKAIPVKPVKPTRASVKDAMTEIAPYIRHCKLTTSGRVVLEMVVSGESGQITSARAIDDTFKGTATGLCAARVVKNVTLPAFQSESLTIIYPFDL